jgi:hypothetical protein
VLSQASPQHTPTAKAEGQQCCFPLLQGCCEAPTESESESDNWFAATESKGNSQRDE